MHPECFYLARKQHTVCWRAHCYMAPCTPACTAHIIWHAFSALYILVCTQRACMWHAPSVFLSCVHPAHLYLACTQHALFWRSRCYMACTQRTSSGKRPAHFVIWRARFYMACTWRLFTWRAPSTLLIPACTLLYRVHPACIIWHAPSALCSGVHYMACTQHASSDTVSPGVHPVRM